MHVILFAGGTVQPGSAVEQALATGELVIAADSGAETALQLGYVPAVVVGDFDSLQPATRSRLESLGCRCLTAATEKDETDTELAVQVALEMGAEQVTLLGALGGSRFDHSIANLLLLAGFAEARLELVDGSARAWLLRGPGKAIITGKAGDLLSLFPLAGDAHGVTTDQLYYPLQQDTLAFGKPRGISNVLLSTQASVELTNGLLFIVHTAV